MVEREISILKEEISYLNRGWERIKGNKIARQLEQRPIELKRVKLEARMEVLKKVLTGEIETVEIDL